MNSKDFSTSAKAVIRSLLSAAEYEKYEKTGLYNLGTGFLNRMVEDLHITGGLTVLQQARLKKRLASCDLNIHLDARSDAKRHGPFLVIKGGKLD